MLFIQTSQTKRLRKYAILTLFGMMLISGWGVVATMHWYVKPPKQQRRLSWRPLSFQYGSGRIIPNN
jgi:hypothetical protein